jgi:4-aminobutyrate aminotransferase-like enzyme
MTGVELPAVDACDRVLGTLRDRGILAGKTGPGRNVLTFLPPLNIDGEELLAAGRLAAETVAEVMEGAPC